MTIIHSTFSPKSLKALYKGNITYEARTEVKWLAIGHPTGQWYSQEQNPGLLNPSLDLRTWKAWEAACGWDSTQSELYLVGAMKNQQCEVVQQTVGVGPLLAEWHWLNSLHLQIWYSSIRDLLLLAVSWPRKVLTHLETLCFFSARSLHVDVFTTDSPVQRTQIQTPPEYSGVLKPDAQLNTTSRTHLWFLLCPWLHLYNGGPQQLTACRVHQFLSSDLGLVIVILVTWQMTTLPMHGFNSVSW